MDKCRYDNKIIYIFDFFDENEQISSEHVQLLKNAGSEGKLICDYCGEKLRFNYGKVIKPYFSHVHDNGKGICKALKESVSQKKIKRVFYEKMLKDNFEIYGEINYRFKNGLYTDLYFEFKDGEKIAIDYIDDIHKLNRMEKTIFFNAENIKYIKVVNVKVPLFKEIQGESNHGYLYSFVDYDYKHLIMLDDIKNEITDLEKSKNSMNSNIILNKKEELKILENQKQKYYTENISPTSGIVSFEYDNDYEKVKLDKLDDINSNILDSLENNFIKINSNSHKVSSSEVALRIINPNETYICIFQDKDKNHFKEAQDLKIISNGQAIKAKIDKIYEKKDEDVIVIKIMEQNMSIYNTRVQEFDIIYKNIKGFKIPVESVVEKNNKLGVYVINEENNIPEFVSLGKNYYKDAKYYYVDYNKNKDENKLNLYDRILLYPNFINKNIKVSR